MKTALLFAGLLLSFLMVAHVSPLEDAPEINQDGICVAEFNASFNFQNSVPWIEKLNDCTTTRVRFQANIMMSMEASKSDVQGAIDEIIMSDF